MNNNNKGNLLAGDYFQALRHIIAPAAPMVQQQI